MKHATTPCAECGEQIVPVSVNGKIVALSPSWPVYVRLADGEGGAGWVRDEAPMGEGRQCLARHRCGEGK